ncbi:hypothetical protein MCERE19_04362 [Spirosomataceae bacterium]
MKINTQLPQNKKQKGFATLFLLLLIMLKMSGTSFAQCNTANFTVTTTNGTCFSNGSITVNVPTSTDCTTGGWIAEIIKLPSGTPITQSVPTTGGAIIFNALQAGSYSVSLSNGFTTVPFASNPVALTTSYVNMNVSTSSTAPSCRNDAPGYTPNGSLTINVANGTGLGPFLYSVTSSTGTQSFTSSSRSNTFSNMPGAEQVSISVTDLANNDAGCAVTVSQSPTTVSNLSSPISFGIRGFNYERDCSNTTASCNNVKLFVNLSNVNAASLASIQLPGNAKITIAGVDYPLTYVSGSARFTYDPVAAGGPQLVDGTVITTTFDGGCNVISQSGTVSMDNSFLTVSPSTETVFANCSVRYKFVIIGDRDVNGSTRAAYFCATNSLKFELRNPDGVTFTDVTSTITNAAGVPLSGTNPMGANLGVSIPSVSSTWYSNQPGFYRVTASDDCHTIVRTLNVTTTNPFGSPVQAIEGTSVLEGTSSISLWFNSLPPLGSPLTMTVRRFDGQTAMTITPTQPLSKAGSYILNFPMTRTFNYPTGFYTISDLPLGRYIVEVTNSCSSTTGLMGTYDITLVKPTSYNPVFSVTNSCTGSNTINYNMNPVNAKPSPYTVRLHRDNGSGGLGTLVATSSSNTLSGSFINLNSGNYVISFENVSPVDNTSWFSPAFNAAGAAQTYTRAITIEPYSDITVSTSTAVCDVNNSNSGIISAQISSGTIVYPMSFTLFDASNLSTPVQGPISVTSPTTSHTFTGLALGNYVVRVTNPCYTVNSNVTVNNSSAVPSAQVSNAAVCPNSPTTIAIISATNNLYDITWKDSNDVVVGTGMPVTLTAAVTTTYTAFYALKSTFNCPNTTINESDVTVTVTPNPDLTLAVSDINLCDGTSPGITISNTQSEFTYEIVDSSGTSFSPALTASGNGGSLNIPIPNTITLVGGQVLKVKATNGNAGCSGILNDFSNVILDTPSTPVPTATSKGNVCPATTVDLTTLQPTAVSGVTYEWHTAASNPTAGTLVATPSAVAVGTYYLYGKSSSGCYSAASSAVTATLTPDNTVSAASSLPTLCINTVLTNITHSTTGATGIGTATGLPAGITAAWAANTITISGTPTASGSFTYSIPLTGGCGTVNATGTITVTADNTVSAASSTPTLCINTALTDITHTTTGATGIGTATGLPAGVTAAWAGNTITISGTPTASGTFTYSIPLTGGCDTLNATGTITVTPDNTVSAASTTPTLCINTALTNITHTTAGATGIGTATGLPAGVTAVWAGNTITISGTPTASGTFTYSIPLTGGCDTLNATGTITVTPENTVSAASTTPTLCINTALTNITHTTTGATGIGTATGLPAGVTAAWAGNTITISGIPTASGTYTYSIPLTGGCDTLNATGTITVTPDNTVSAASSTPTLCVNTSLTNITHTTTGATGIGTATGLPAGVTAVWSGDTITISGTPTASGTFTYSIPLTGGCDTLNATGTITVTPDNTVSAASTTPTLCINTALTDITHTTTGATGIGTATGLPAGVTAAWAGNTITISGTPTASGTFTYSIPLTGGCGAVNATGTITVNAIPSTVVPTATSKSNVCPATTVDLTTLQPTAVSGVTYEWHTVASNPTSGTLVASPAAAASGTYYLYGKSASGCYSAASSAITATVNACIPCTPVDPGIASASAASIKTGNTASFTLTGATAGATTTWAIFPSNGVSPSTGTGTSTGLVTFNIAGEYQVLFSTTNSNTPVGCSEPSFATASSQFLVEAPLNPCAKPSASSVAVSPASAAISVGATASFTMSGGTPNTSVQWVIIPSAGVSPSSGTGTSTGSVTFANKGLYNAVFSIVNLGDGSCAPVQQSSSAPIAVGLSPCSPPTSMLINASAANQSSNVGQSVTFTATGGIPGVQTWTVTPAIGASPSSGTGNIATITFTEGGIYSVVFTSKNSTIPLGCTQAVNTSASIMHNVTCPKPVLTIQNITCSGTGYTVTFSSNATVTTNNGTVSGNTVTVSTGNAILTSTTSCGEVASMVITAPVCPIPTTCTRVPSLSVGNALCTGTGTYTISFSATNGTVTSSVGTVSGNTVINIPVGTNAVLTLTPTSTACSGQSITVVSPVSCATPSCTDGSVGMSYSTACNNSGTYNINYTTSINGTTVTSSANSFADLTGTVTLTVTKPGCSPQSVVVSAPACVPFIPKAVNDLLTAPQGLTSTVNVLTNDDFLPGTTTSLTVISGGTATGTATFDPLTGILSYLPAPGESGLVTLKYRVCDTIPNPDVCAEATVSITITASNAKLNLKVLLQGALLPTSSSGGPIMTGIMRDDLRTASPSQIPNLEPYTGLANSRFTHVGGGGETMGVGVLSAVGNDAIVDWVFVELRDKNNPATVLKTRSALVQRDGDVVESTDGISPLTFTGAVGESYYVSVKHRNHLGAMTAGAIAMTVTGTLVDFTTMTAVQTYNLPGYDGFEQVDVNGKMALWAGNTNAKIKVKYVGVDNDQIPVFSQTVNYVTNTTEQYNFDFATPVYLYGDINMDAKVKYRGPNNDTSFIFFNVITKYALLNTGALYNYDLFIEQLP